MTKLKHTKIEDSLTLREYPLAVLLNHENSSYIYDARTKLLTQLEYRVNDISTLKKVLEENSTVFLPNGLLKIVPDEIELVNKILPSFKNYIPRKFILEITEECTLRCKYCFYTNEKSLRKHSNNP